MNFIDEETIELEGETYKHSHIVDRYYVSKDGKILSLHKNGSYSILKGTKVYNANKYPLQVCVCVYRQDAYSKVFNVGRLVLDAYDVEQTKDADGTLRTEVDHIDNDPFNNNLDNLRWATRKENMSNRKYYGDKISKANKHRVWITDGFIDYRVHKDAQLPLGFKYGRTHHK